MVNKTNQHNIRQKGKYYKEYLYIPSLTYTEINAIHNKHKNPKIYHLRNTSQHKPCHAKNHKSLIKMK